MTSEAQIAANRKNALKSTGPRTSKGKAVSRRNAVRHGVLSENVAVVGDDADIFRNLRSGLMNDFDPQTEMESLMVDRIAILFWRERQLVNSESSMISESLGDIRRGPYIPPTLSLVNQLLVGRYQTMLTNQIASTIDQLRRSQQSRSEAQRLENASEPQAPDVRTLPPARPRTRAIRSDSD